MNADEIAEAVAGGALGLLIGRLDGDDLASVALKASLQHLAATGDLADALKLMLAQLDPPQLATLTEAASTTWQVQTVPRPAGE